MRVLIFVASMLLTTSIFAAQNFNQDRFMVKVKAGQELPLTAEMKSAKNLFGNVYVVYPKNYNQLFNELSKHNAVEIIERDYRSQKRELAKKVKDLELLGPVYKEDSATPFNDPKVSKVWSFKNSEQNGISVSRAYANRRSSPKEQIIVAVVDTGVDYNHEDLKDVMWVNEAEKNGVAGVDDDGNGYVDDIHGINTLSRDSNGNATGDPRDTHSHGTHVSGTIGAKQNNNVGIAGIASNVKIMAIRTVPNSGDETDVDVVESFIYAATNGARVINCSFGKAVNEGGMIVSEAIDFIGKEYGTLVVAAAGNSSRNIDTRLTYPASFENETLLVVASTTSRGSMSYFSNYGLKNVDVAAPGSSIYSTTPNNRYSSMSGTSMASPTTAGVAAEVLANNPDLTAKELKEVLMNTVIKVGSFARKMGSGGRVDLEKSLQAAFDQ